VKCFGFCSEAPSSSRTDFLQVVEFDTPWRLIQTGGGVFRYMCLKSGIFNKLEATARAKEENDLR